MTAAPQSFSNHSSNSQSPDTQGSDTQGSPTQGSDIQGSDTQGSPTQGSDIQGSDIQGSDIQGSDIQGSDTQSLENQGPDNQGPDNQDSGDSVSQQILDRLNKISRSIPDSVKLIAVTKTFPADIVRVAYAAGIREFAENKVQEAITKQSELSDLTDVTWHFIGHVQSNKSRKVVENFDWIHSVDSVKLATRMNRQAHELGKQVNCCLQVKLASDPTKDGFEKADLLAALPTLDELSSLSIKGLMVIPPYGLPDEKTAAIFAAGYELVTEIKAMGLTRIQMEELSMGMSGDFELAIAQGATMIRLGSILFGRRS